MDREKSWLLLVTAGIWALLAVGSAWRAVERQGVRSWPVTLCVLYAMTAALTMTRWWMERRRGARQNRL